MVVATGSTTVDVRDGRIARGLRTREAILGAYESLIMNESVPPTGTVLAVRAGVSPRSVFTHFGDMDGVLAGAARRAFDWIVETHVDISCELPLEERLDRFTSRQAEILERTAPLYRMFRAVRQGGRRGTSPAVNEILGGVDQIRRRYVEFLFGREFDLMAPAERKVVMEALVVTCSWNAWEGLRAAQLLEPDTATAVMKRLMASLLA